MAKLEEVRLFYSDGSYEKLTPTETIHRFAKTIIKAVEGMNPEK